MSGRWVERARTASVLLVLLAVVAAQAPGQVVADTKLDLTQDPWGLMARALHLWDPQAAFGQLQNQAYGYLFPMAPFHAVLGEVLPAWVVQRVWWFALLVAGYLGMRRLAVALGAGSGWAVHVGGLAFALSPRVLSTLGPISSEAAPLLLAPWILLPLVRASAGEVSPRRAAAWSGLAILLVGGVNATAALAAALPAALWVLTRSGWWRSPLTWWWGVAGVLATGWWVGPLLVLGRYSPPFLDWIEDARAVSTNVEPFDVLRGASHWLGYVVTSAGPWWDAGFDLATDPWLVLATAVVAALGLVGLCLRPVPHRGFLVGCLAVGVVLICLPQDGLLASPVAAQARDLLDGPLAPLRNVHKLDPLVRIPLVLGLVRVLALSSGVLGDLMSSPVRQWRPAGVVRALATVLAVVSVTGAAVPALGGRLPSAGSFQDVPSWWQQTADWLGERPEDGRALLVPASNFGQYGWGSPLDEPLQPLATSRWAVRNGVPLTPAGSTRLLDAVEQEVRSGSDLTASAAVLRRSGVRYVVLRNDLDTRLTGGTPVSVARAAIRATPGLRVVAAFGPQVQLPTEVSARVIEVYDLGEPSPEVSAYPADVVTAVTGASESLVDLAAAGLLDQDRAAVLAGDLADGTPPGSLRAASILVTDSLRARHRSFGAARTVDAGPVQTSEQVARSVERDYLPWPDPDLRTVAEYAGLSDLRSSPLAGPPASPLAESPAHRLYSALDTDPATSWVSLVGDDGTVWLELDLVRPQPVDGTRLRLLADEVTWPSGLALPTSATVTTDTGAATTRVGDPEDEILLDVPAGSTSWLRVRLDGLDGDVAGIVSLVVPGLTVSERLVVPDLPPAVGAPVEEHLLVQDGAVSDGCLLQSDVLRCSPDDVSSGTATDLVRSVPVTVAGDRTVSGTMRAQPGPDLDRLLDVGGWARVESSSRASLAGAARPGAVVDGDQRTAWSPSPADDRPSLRLTLPAPQRFDRLQLVARDGWFADADVTVRVEVDGQEQFASPTSSGVLDLVAVRGTDVLVEILPELGEADATVTAGTLEVSEVRISDLAAVPQPTGVLACGLGPALAVDGALVPTSARFTVDDLLLGRPVGWEACAPVPLAAGRAVVALGRLPGLVPSTVLLAPAAPAPDRGTVRDVALVTEHVVGREVAVGPGAAVLLTTTHNTNPGWVATLDGARLDPVVVDGWRQAWLVPAGEGGTVEIRFGPDPTYRMLLLIGAVLVLVLVVLTVAPGARRPPQSSARIPRWLHPVGVVGTTAALAGWAGALVGLAVVLLVSRVGPGARAVAVSGSAVLLAALVRDLSPLPGRPVWADAVGRLLVVLAIAVPLAIAVSRTRPVGPADEGLLDDVEGQRREQQRGGDDHRQDVADVTGEDRDTGHRVEPLQDGQVPQEDPVRDPAEVPPDGPTQEPGRHRSG